MSKPVREDLTLVQGETLDRAIRLCSQHRSINDALIVASDATITSSLARFAATDVGRRILINGAGSNGGILDTTIASVTSATIAELDDAAVQSVNKGIAYIYTPMNLTGWTINSQIRDIESENGDLLVELDIDRDDLTGRVVRSLSAVVSEDLPAIKAWHDFRMIDVAGSVRVWTRGRINILPRITV